MGRRSAARADLARDQRRHRPRHRQGGVSEMGMLYKRKYKRKDGTIAEASVWWIKYYRDGIPMRESTESDKESVAKNLLRQREGDISRGVPVTPQTNRATVGELLD